MPVEDCGGVAAVEDGGGVEGVGPDASSSELHSIEIEAAIPMAGTGDNVAAVGRAGAEPGLRAGVAEAPVELVAELLRGALVGDADRAPAPTDVVVGVGRADAEAVEALSSESESVSSRIGWLNDVTMNLKGMGVYFSYKLLYYCH